MKTNIASRFMQSLRSWSGVCLVASILGGCSSYAVIDNTAITAATANHAYSLKNWGGADRSGEFAFIVTFSGGGTRAAAMAYGVLEELRDTQVLVGGQQERLLDEVDHISSVSGGSFTAAYYGLHGDGLFDSFKDNFLRLDMDADLARSLFNPFHWFGRKGRTQRAIEYYEKKIFHNATFADMMQAGRPMIVVNASDLAYGVRFSFIQEYFNFLCSDLTNFSVARAVTASSAVPVLFNPVVLENYADCAGYEPIWPENVDELAKHSADFAMLYEGLSSYSKKDERKYIHFVDGGITDNMGLRALHDVVTISGGSESYLQKMHRKTPRRVVLISVNASTEQKTDMDQSTEQPSILAAMNATTDAQIHRYNSATLELVEGQLADWAEQLSSPDAPVTPYLIRVSFDQVAQPHLKAFLNKIPTSFNLTDEQVNTLIESARTLLREEPSFKKLKADLAIQ